MRYTVGQNYPFVHCKFRYPSGHVSDTGLYLPWEEGTELLNLEVVVLQCAEHHKVANAHEPEGEKSCDGFVFVEPSSGARWLNQYPMASYGQMSDRADRLVSLDPGAEMQQGDWSKLFDRNDREPTLKLDMHDGRHFLADIRRGRVSLTTVTNFSGEQKEEAVEALKAYEERVWKLMETAAGKKLRLLQISYPAHEGQKQERRLDWFEVVFEDEPEYEHPQQQRDPNGPARQLLEPLPL